VRLFYTSFFEGDGLLDTLLALARGSTLCGWLRSRQVIIHRKVAICVRNLSIPVLMGDRTVIRDLFGIWLGSALFFAFGI
jgi:hypothetical protein